MDFKYVLGLDIGIGSVGYCLMELDNSDIVTRVLHTGVRFFNRPEDRAKGNTLASKRREGRGKRRNLRRKKLRMEDTKKYLMAHGLVKDMDAFENRYHKKSLPDVYKLRADALERKLTNHELAQILLHMSKHRGFMSTRKCEQKDKDTGKILSSGNENIELFKSSGYQTIGEMIYKDERFHTPCGNGNTHYISIRNKQDDYRNTILREPLIDELNVIFKKQREFGNKTVTKEFEEGFMKLFLRQRSFDEGPGAESPYAMDGFRNMLGKCTFEPEEPRASKGSYSAELFVALQTINSIKMINSSGEKRSLSEEERNKIIELLGKRKEIKYSAIRKLLNLPLDEKFNYLDYSEETEGKKKKKKGKKEEEKQEVKPKTPEEIIKKTEDVACISMGNAYAFRKVFGKVLDEMEDDERTEFLDEIGTILSLYKSDRLRKENLSKFHFEPDVMDKVLELNPKGTLNLSLKAIYNILPFLKEGYLYNEACELAGYSFLGNMDFTKQKYLKGEQINKILQAIPNPVAKRAISQTIKVTNAIIRKYGSPTFVNIELSREMSKSFLERKKIIAQNKKNLEFNKGVKDSLLQSGFLSPTGYDIVKYKLWKEQGGIDPYTGKKIPLEKLFSNDYYEIDHCLPYSQSYNDSYANKVVCETATNREKGSQTPYEYLSRKGMWEFFKSFVESHIKNYNKKKNLLKHHITEEDMAEYATRNINDTRYITKIVLSIMQNCLELAPYDGEAKRKVLALNGGVTDYLRKMWGFSNKSRETDNHHAIDAAIIASCTDSMIKRITSSSKKRENQYIKGTADRDENGRMISRDEWNKRYGTRIEKPYDYFREEVEIRTMDSPLDYIMSHQDVQARLGYPSYYYELNLIKPFFVSVMPEHGVAGHAHQETTRSMKYYEECGGTVVKKPLTSLSLDRNNEIAGYLKPETDLRLYNALKERLIEFGGDAKKAFSEPFYKPCKDGKVGNLVRTVKTFENNTLLVNLNNHNGVAKNEKIIRIDIFKEDGKYYGVPVYVADTIKDVLPDRVIAPNKPYEKWKKMEDENFLFSLHLNDAFSFRTKKGKDGKNAKGETRKMDGEVLYLLGFDISSSSIKARTHNKEYEIRLSMGVMEDLKKYDVGLLGECHEIKKEKRLGFH